jgi:hypothetical protein
MRRGKRLAIVLALGATGVLAVAGIALAAAATSTVSFKFTKVPAGALGTTFKSGKLNVHTHTNYTTPKTDTTRAQLYFDNDIKFNPTSAPKCNTGSAAYMNAKTLKQAMAACGSATLVGTGTAKVNISAPGDTTGCVLAFNATVSGKPGLALFVSAIPFKSYSCANPASNTQGTTAVRVSATFLANPTTLGPDFTGGKELDFDGSGIPSAAPLSDFNVTLQKGTYVQAKCGDSNKLLNMRTVFTYTTPHDPNPPTTSKQTVLSQQTCT